MKRQEYKQAVTKYLYNSLGYALIIASCWYLSQTPGGAHSTQQFFDRIRITDTRTEAVVVGIDDASLEKMGAWPWNRKVFADLTEKLDSYGAKVVVYDILFLEQREGDVPFRDALEHLHTSNVILASKVENGNYLSSFLLTSSTTMSSSGLSNVIPDVDGKVRKYPPSMIEHGTCVYGLGEYAFHLFTFSKDTHCSLKNQYFRYPEMVTTYSAADVLSGKIAPQNFKGKAVFIGSTALDLEDHFVGMSGEKIPGVQVHASIFSSLMNREGDKDLEGFFLGVLFSLFSFLPLLILRYIRSIGVQVVAVIVLLLSVFVTVYLFFVNHVIVPFPWIVLAVILSGAYASGLRFIEERKKSEYVQSLFSKYVHKDVLYELMKSPGKINLMGEKRYLTVLFSDLRGFTSLSESLSPEALTHVLNGYFSAVTPIILDEHGTVDKFIGDAVMAFWNAPLPVDNHEMCAVLSAIRMQEAIAVFNKENGYNLSVGIGIHSGETVVGNVGSLERVNYTVLGDTVNLASRVEGLTKKYGVGILVTEEVKSKVNTSDVLFRKVDSIIVQGKTEITTLYEVMKRSDNAHDLIARYDLAFKAYQRGDFSEALLLFKVLGDNGDTPSVVMIKRIGGLTKNDTWNGVWHWNEK